MCSKAARRGASIGLAAIAVVLGFSACGKKGPPLPPLRVVPQAASDLVVLQRGHELIFEFAYPATTAAGTVVGALEAVELLVFTRPPAPEGALAATGPIAAREFTAGATEALRISGSELVSAIDGDRVRLRLPVPAATASFAVRNVAAGGERSALSNVVTVAPGEPPPAPARLAVTGAQEGVRLSWEPVPASVGTRVYRRDATRRAFGKPLATVVASEASHLDVSAQFGSRYVYTVVSLAAPTVPAPPPAPAVDPAPPIATPPTTTPPEAAPPAVATPPASPAPPPPKPPIESAAAGEQEIHHLDRFPPAPPGRVVALADGGRVRLVWEASASKDVAGYVVSRQAPGETGFRPISATPAELITELETTDASVTPGALYRYRVAAVDLAGNVGQPSAAVETTGQ